MNVLFYSLFTSNWIKLLWMPVFGYGFAWIGHFFFEKNRPATFIYPVFSLMGDWVMFKDILTGKKWHFEFRISPAFAGAATRRLVLRIWFLNLALNQNLIFFNLYLINESWRGKK